MRKVLVVGCGRAGQRHKQLAEIFGLDVTGADPNVHEIWVRYHALDAALFQENFDFVVLATPPDQHLAGLKLCIEKKIPTLCEKPLCSLTELLDSELLAGWHVAPSPHVMMAYNYAFHPKIMNPEWTGSVSGGWAVISYQNRPPLPPWGHFLDHAPHSIFILLRMVGGLRANHCQAVETSEGSEFRIMGATTTDEAFLIYDSVRFSPVERYTAIHSPKGLMRLDDPEDLQMMMVDMWESFLAGKEYWPDLKIAYEVQRQLMRAHFLTFLNPEFFKKR